jgi:hypothetical protein
VRSKGASVHQTRVEQDQRVAGPMGGVPGPDPAQLDIVLHLPDLLIAVGDDQLGEGNQLVHGPAAQAAAQQLLG